MTVRFPVCEGTFLYVLGLTVLGLVLSLGVYFIYMRIITGHLGYTFGGILFLFLGISVTLTWLWVKNGTHRWVGWKLCDR